MSVKKNLFNGLKLLFGLGIWAFGLFLILCFLLRSLSGDKFLIVRLTNYLMPWFGMGVLICLIIAGWRKNYYLVVLLVFPLFLIGHGYVPRIPSCSKTTMSDDQFLKIMSYNVWEYNKNLSTTAIVIEQEKPDILLLQEVRPKWIPIFKDALGKAYSNKFVYVAYEPKIMQAVFSRYSVQKIDAFPEKGRAQKVIIRTPYGIIKVINIHAHKKGWKHRHLQMKQLLKDDISPEEGPLILGGDFNTNEQSQTYTMVNSYLHNAHRRIGCGFGFTYPSRSSFATGKFPILHKFPVFPVIRIDHIFYNNRFIQRNARTLYGSDGSDHLPVVVELLINDDMVKSSLPINDTGTPSG